MEIKKEDWRRRDFLKVLGVGAVGAGSVAAGHGERTLTGAFTPTARTVNSAARSIKRLVCIKVDGLPQHIVERYVNERDARTGKSALPWFKHIFYERGARASNFYVRGMSISGPSWALLDTGQHAHIRGNVEFDRYTLHAYDYLNFIPFYLNSAIGRRVDMPGPEVLDEIGVPLLMDAFPYEERYTGFQLYQRGLRWTTLERGLRNRFSSRSPRELVDEWTTGFELRSIVHEQLERELIGKLSDARVRYLDYYTTEYDHAAHHNRDRETQLAALQETDAVLGRIWMAIRKSPLAAETVLVLVSDHGTNTDEKIYSQGYNLVKLLGSEDGGGHHVITKRRLMLDYAIKGIYPLVPIITTTTADSFYLKGQSTSYPTAMLDFDGNERAAIHLRNSDANVLQMLLQQLQRRDLPAPIARVATREFFATIERRRKTLSIVAQELDEELGALRRTIERQRAVVAALPKEWTQQDSDTGHDKEARREAIRLSSLIEDERTYSEYARTLKNTLALRPGSFDPQQLAIEDHIGKGAMGDANTIYQLQNYVVGLGRGGRSDETPSLALGGDGALDRARSFTRVNYLELLRGVFVRNNVQEGVNPQPIDFVAVRIAREEIAEALGAELRAEEIVWLYRAPDSQALVLARHDRNKRLWLRCLPVANLRQDETGWTNFARAKWRDDLPLKIWEDANAQYPAGASRETWLDDWHTDREWLAALHRTWYSNAVVGLHEQFARHPIASLDLDQPHITTDERLLRRFRLRQRVLVEPDLQVFANNHWNFDVRGFNPGGNHGSFFRVSTHSTLMFAGGEATGVAQGAEITEPHDSLDYIPTVLALLNNSSTFEERIPVAWKESEPSFPGQIIKGIFTDDLRTDEPKVIE